MTAPKCHSNYGQCGDVSQSQKHGIITLSHSSLFYCFKSSNMLNQKAMKYLHVFHVFKPGMSKRFVLWVKIVKSKVLESQKKSYF